MSLTPAVAEALRLAASRPLPANIKQEISGILASWGLT
jgi:hypothetical protein